MNIIKEKLNIVSIKLGILICKKLIRGFLFNPRIRSEVWKISRKFRKILVHRICINSRIRFQVRSTKLVQDCLTHSQDLKKSDVWLELIYIKWRSNLLTLIETRKSRGIQSDNDYEKKIPYKQTFRCWYLVTFMKRKFCIYGIFSS